MRRSISSSVSWRNASAVFFQLLEFILIFDHGHRPQLADLVIDLDQFLAQAVELMVSLHLLLHFFEFPSQGQISRLGLASHTGIPQVLWSVPGMIFPSTGAVALAALAIVHRDGAAPEIAESFQFPV